MNIFPLRGALEKPLLLRLALSIAAAAWLYLKYENNWRQNQLDRTIHMKRAVFPGGNE